MATQIQIRGKTQSKILISVLWRRRRICPRNANPLQFHGRHAPGVLLSDAIIATFAVFLFSFIIILLQERVGWRAIVFREADGAFLACPCFQLMCNDRPESFGPTPYHKKQTDGRRGAKEDKRERADRLRFGRWARLSGRKRRCHLGEIRVDAMQRW